MRKMDFKPSKIIDYILLALLAIVLYSWTVNLPIIGDGLMHMEDYIDLTKPLNWIKTFFTLDGLGKEQGYVTDLFYRPIFNDIIVQNIKNITNSNTLLIRTTSILIFATNSLLVYRMSFSLCQSRFISFGSGCLFIFSLAYFLPVYEFGTSFSLWLTLFFILSIIFAIEYKNTHSNKYFILSLVFSFITIFTKESAITIGVALSLYVLGNEFIEKRKLSKKTCCYVGIQALITISYFLLRYLRVGAFFNIAGGIENRIELVSAIRKAVGFFLYSFNIPIKATFYEFMIPTLKSIPLLMALIAVGFSVSIIIHIISKIIKNPIKEYQIIIYLLMFLILIIPTFKVTRNGIYYNDLALIALIMLYVYLAQSLYSNRKVLLASFIIVYISTFLLMLDSVVNTNLNVYTVGTETAFAIENKLHSIDKHKVVLQGDSFYNSMDSIYLYNHGHIGSFYNVNVDPTADVLPVNDEYIKNFDSEQILIDYAYDKSNRTNINVQSYALGEKTSKIMRISYSYQNVSESMKINTLRYEYIKNGTTFENTVDVLFRKNNNKLPYIYVVIPFDSELSIDGNFFHADINLEEVILESDN